MRAALILPLIFFTTACQIPYLLKSAYHQSQLMYARVPTEKALKDPKVSEEQKNKIRLAEEARQFAEKNLHLKPTKNYRSYVKVDGPYVTYVVTVAPIDKLEHFLWSFPIVGKVPYKGYFNVEDAKKEAANFPKDKYDTYVRGVTAYSTLGWFDDPLLSTMLQYSDYDLVNVVIHETVHATLYIKGHADFNERLASFIGNLGAEEFYLAKEGKDSLHLRQIKNENADEALFAEFIGKEIKNLREWYANKKGQFASGEREARLKEIQTRFSKELQPKLKSDSYKRFPEMHLNNASLLGYETYVVDQSDFNKAFEKLGRDFGALLKFCKNLEKSKDPEAELKSFSSSP